MAATSPALEKCKLNIFLALEAGGNETPALLRSSIKLLQADNILDFLVEGKFDAAIGIGEDLADISGLALVEEYLNDYNKQKNIHRAANKSV